MEDMKSAVNFFFEIGRFGRSERSGFPFLMENQSLSEHVHRTVHIGLFLASCEPEVDAGKVALMCLLHDLPESRTGDVNHLYGQYVEANEAKAMDDMLESLPEAFQKRVRALHGEYEERESREAVLAKEADILDLLVSMKEYMDKGNISAKRWFDGNITRLKTERGKAIAEAIKTTKMDEWWVTEKHLEWVAKNKS